MAEKKLDIKLGVVGDAKVGGALSRISGGLKSLKKDTSALKDLKELFTSGIVVAGFDRGVRALGGFVQKLAEVRAGLVSAKNAVRELLENTPLFGAGIELGKGLKAWWDPEGTLEKAITARRAAGLERFEVGAVTGGREALRQSQAERRMRTIPTDANAARAAAKAEFDKVIKGRYDDLLGRSILSGMAGDQDLRRRLEAEAEIVADEARKAMEKAINRANEKPIISNAIKRSRAGLQDFLTRVGLAGATAIEGGGGSLAQLAFPRRRPPIIPGLPISRLAETFDSTGTTASAFIARENAAVEEARVAADTRAAEKQEDAAEKQQRAAEVMKNAAAGFIGVMQDFGAIVGAAKPIG